MSGVSALSGARGSFVAAPNSSDPIARNLGRVEVVELGAVDSVWALRTSWYEQGLYPRLDDLWWRRLDSFVADCDDPRILAIVDRMRAQCHGDEPPFDVPEVVDAATGESGIVELILESDQSWREGSFLGRGDDLLVDLIRLERARW